MSCTSCGGHLDDGGLQFRCCQHFTCLNCLTEATKTTIRKTIPCLTNKPGIKLTCSGFLNDSDIQWFIRRTGNGQAVENEPQPSTSKSLSLCPRDPESEEPEEDDDFEDLDMDMVDPVTFEELQLTPEELETGWGQVASKINDLVQSGLPFDQASQEVDLLPLWIPETPFKCLICLEDMRPNDGIILKDCFHIFCRDCLRQHIEVAEDAEVKCPFNDGEYSCQSFVKPREMQHLVSTQIYNKHYEELSLKEAAQGSSDVFNCRTPNCPGFCFYEDTGAGSMIFHCPKCTKRNCIPCKAIHAKTCAEYWQGIEDEENKIRRLEQEEKDRKRKLEEDEKNRIQQHRNERLSEEMINSNLNQRNFMRCPRCNIPCYKFTGCNHVTCSSCKLQFNWSGKEPTAFR